MTRYKWNYCGDINLVHGGYFWREDGADDYVMVVRVTPCSDAGGPDNLFWIEDGSLYIPDKPEELRAALQCCGYDQGGKPSRAMIVDALIAYRGFDHESRVVRFGPAQPANREFDSIEVDTVLRANASLRNYVKNNYLGN